MITQDLSCVQKELSQGGMVAIPTETVYGLAANALDAKAVSKIYALKQRPLDHPLIVHVPDIESVNKLVLRFPENAMKLAKRFWPGPLTLVLPKSDLVPDLTTGGLSSVAVRIPDHPLTLELLKKTGFALAAPSANPFGSVSPTTAKHVEESFQQSPLLVLDGGTCAVGMESTIVSFLNDEPMILRVGGLSVEKIEKEIGKIKIAEKTEKPIAPGMLEKHYATRTPLVLLNEWEKVPPKGKKGLLIFKEAQQKEIYDCIEVLGPSGDLEEAATQLYAAMRKLDLASLDLIVAYRFPEIGLGRAINDRLERASYGKVADFLKSE